MTRNTYGLDAYLTRTPREESWWCPLCELNARDCEDEESHEGEWETMRERALQEYEDRAYEWHHDECERNA